MQAFYRRDGDTFHASVHTRGPWDEGTQHGGPPSGLLLRVLRERVANEAGVHFAVARLTTEFLRPVPVGPLKVDVHGLRAGRTAVRVAATLRAEREVMSASAVFLRQAPDVAPPPARPEGHQDDVWPAPEAVEPFVFPFFTTDEGYHRAVELRLIDPPWGATPVRFWARPTVSLIDGELTAPEEAVVIVADAESGMGPPVDPLAFTFLNPDLTVYFARRPAPGPVGMAIRSTVGDAGVGLSEASLRDARGIFGRSAQSLVISPRPPTRRRRSPP